MTTVPLNLAVSDSAQANLELPGSTQTGSIVAISVLSPTASLPIGQGSASVGGGNFDGDGVYYPAPGQTNMEYATPLDPDGYKLLASFNLNVGGGVGAPTPAPGQVPAPTPTPNATPVPAAGPPAAPNGGLRLGTGPVLTNNAGVPLTVGQAQNPPTVSTTQTLTGLLGGAASTKHKRVPVVLGSGTTTVPSGQTVSLTVTLTPAARKALKRSHSLKVTETIVTRNGAGQTQTTTRTVTIRLQRKHK